MYFFFNFNTGTRSYIVMPAGLRLSSEVERSKGPPGWMAVRRCTVVRAFVPVSWTTRVARPHAHDTGRGFGFRWARFLLGRIRPPALPGRWGWRHRDLRPTQRLFPATAASGGACGAFRGRLEPPPPGLPGVLPGPSRGGALLCTKPFVHG